MDRAPNPEMLVLAREFRNLTQEELGRRVQLSQVSIARVENGATSIISDAKFAEIAEALGFPLSFFFLPEQRLGFGSSAYYYRKKSQISAADRRRIQSSVNLLRIHLKRLLQSVDLQSQRQLPEVEIDEVDGGAAGAARFLRAKWCLPDGPIQNLTALVESAGVLVVSCDFGTRSMDATSFRLVGLPPLILMNRDLPADRWRFTLAHELAHLILHQSPTETMEDEADAFAAELLMPAVELRAAFARLGHVRLQDLAAMKLYWKTSMASLLFQAGQLGVLSKQESRALWMQLSKLGYRSKEPYELEPEMPFVHPGLFAYLQDEVGMSLEDIAASVCWNVEEFVALHGLQSGRKRGHLQIVK